jgi:hypothetical protein
MLIQSRFLYIYHDDYGYASLSYAIVIPSVSGYEYSIPQLVEFLNEHYNIWGGRIAFYGIEILSLRWGFWPYRIIHSIALTLILVATYSFLSHFYRGSRARWLIAFSLCCLYGLIDLKLHRNGTYWPSAAATYVWPFLTLFVAASLHMTMIEDGRLGWRVPVLGVAYLLTGLSQEQIGLIAITFVSGLILINLWQKKGRQTLSIHLFALTCLLAGFAVLVFAPGNQARLNHAIYDSFAALSLIEKVKLNATAIAEINLGQHNQLLLLSWALLCAAVIWMAYSSGKKPRRVYFTTFVLCAFFSFTLPIAAIPFFSEFTSWIYGPLYGPSLDNWSLIFWTVFLGAAFLAILLFCLDKGLHALLALFIGGLLSQFVMLTSPTLTVRSSLIFLFTLFPVLAAMLTDSALKFRRQPLVKLTLLTMFIIASLNTVDLIAGYSGNSPVMESNDQILRQARLSIDEGSTIEEIELSKLPDDRFAGEMPYTQGYDYIDGWIKQYYDIPPDVELIWR